MKNKVISFLLCTITILSVSIIMPLTAYATYTGYYEAPSSYAGSYSTAINKYSCSTDLNTALGSKCFAKFKDYKALGTMFIESNNRKITVKLMEYDPQNAHDEVKVYTATFTGITPNALKVSSTTTPGNIEAVGNHVCELYIKYKVDKLSGDPTTASIASGLFKYQVGIE